MNGPRWDAALVGGTLAAALGRASTVDARFSSGRAAS